MEYKRVRTRYFGELERYLENSKTVIMTTDLIASEREKEIAILKLKRTVDAIIEAEEMHEQFYNLMDNHLAAWHRRTGELR